jgi:hypothetical protein
MPVIKKLPKNHEDEPDRYQVRINNAVSAKATTLKKAHYHAAIVEALDKQYQKDRNSTSREYHEAILKGIEETRAALAAKPPGAHLPRNPGGGKLALQKLAQEERDREANRRLNQTPTRMGGPSSGSGLAPAQRQADLAAQKQREARTKARQKAVSTKAAKRTSYFTSGPKNFWKNF